jgi:hypothetical protein
MGTVALFTILFLGLCNCGYKTGSSYTNVTVDSHGMPLDVGHRVGTMSGVFLARPQTQQFDIQYEFLVTRKNLSFEGSEAKADVKVKYLHVPVLFRYGPKLFRGNPWLVTSLKAFAGPSIAFRLNAEATGDFPGARDGANVEDQFEPLDLGFVIGASLESHGLLVDARYTRGLDNLYSGAGREQFKVNNRAFWILVGLRFGIMEPIKWKTQN